MKFRIRRQHNTALEVAVQEQFLRRALEHLRRDLLEHVTGWDDAALRQRILEGITRAERYGLKTQREVMCFVDTSFLLGEHFDRDPEHPWVGDVLRSGKLAAGDRATLLLATACSVRRDARG